jgi:metallo-beta-lactamase class B
MSFFFNVTDGNKNYIAGMHGGVGLNTLSSEFITKNGFSFDSRKKYFESLDKLECEQVDIVLGNHVGQNDTVGKLKRVGEGEADAFVDPTEWKRFLAKYRAKLEKLIESEKTDS